MGEFIVYYTQKRFGFADFIRGLIYLTERYPNHRATILFNSPFDKFFDVVAIPSFTQEKLTIVSSESDLPEDPSNYRFLCNLYPKGSIDLSKYFVPSEILKKRIDELTPERDFISVHYRTGDKYLRKNGICKSHDNLADYEKVKNTILTLNEENILFHSDNIELKKYLSFPTLDIEPVHVADEDNLNKLCDTLAEFYVISRASKVYVLINPDSSSLPGRFSTFAAKIGGKEYFELKIR